MRTILLTLCILSVTVSAKAQALFGKPWDDGAYYDLKGNKTVGVISWGPPSQTVFSREGDYIFYKANDDAQKVKITTKELSGFTMGKDSFVVTHVKDLGKYPVLAVLLNTPTKLYLSTTIYSTMSGNTAMGGTLKYYYYGTTPEDIVKITRSNFVEIMTGVMADKPEVVAKIKDKTFKYGRIDKLVEYYQTGIIPKNEIVIWPKTKDGKADDMY